MNLETQVTRTYKAAYRGQNGFWGGPTEPHEIANVSEAVDRHRRAAFVLEHKKRAVPDLETMKAENAKTDDLLTLKENIQHLRAEHIEDLQKLYDSHGVDYVNEVMDRSSSKPEGALPDREERIVQEIYNGAHKDAQLQLEWADDYELMRYTYLKRLLEVQRQQAEMEKAHEILRKRLEQQFPQSKEDFSSKPKDVRMRAARFLVANRPKQELMLAEFNWAWRQVKPLQDVFAQDEIFSAEIRAMIISADTVVRDPRRRVT